MFKDSDYRWTYKKKTGKRLTRKQFEQALSKIQQNMESEVKPFTDDSPKARNERKRRATVDYEFFCKTYLPHYFTKEFGDIHRELISYIETGGKSLNCIAYPREHGKSVNASFGKPLQMALCNISPYTIIISDTFELASEFITWIKVEIEENPRIKQDFDDDPLHPLKTEGQWQDGDIVIKGRNRVRGMGHNQKIRGTRFKQFRPFYIVIDDLENDLNVRNKAMVKQKMNLILGAIYGSMDDNGTLLMVGTMLDKNSVLSNMIKHIDEKGDEFKEKFGIKGMNAAIYSAIVDEGTPNERPCWPEGKTLTQLKKIKFVVGELVWAAEFRNKPIDTGIYKLEWIKGFDREILMVTPKRWVYFSGSDASAREEEQNDYKAHVISALNLEDPVKRYVVDAWIRKQSMGDFFNKYIEFHEYYHMALSAFEVNNFQIFVKQELERMCRGKSIYPNFKEVTQSQNKFVRCSSWQGMVERADLLFSLGYGDMELLVFMLNNLGTKAHDDGVDAMDMSLDASMGWRGEFSFMSSGGREMSGGGGRRFSSMIRGRY